MKWWFYIDGKVSKRRYSASELLFHPEFHSGSLVYDEEQKSWVKAAEIEQLKVRLKRQKFGNRCKSSLNPPTGMESSSRARRSEQIKLVQEILNLVDQEKYRYGTEITAALLAGERSEKFEQLSLSNHPHHGFFDKYSARQLRIIIRKLINLDLLEEVRITSGILVLEISGRGEAVLKGDEVPVFTVPKLDS